MINSIKTTLENNPAINFTPNQLVETDTPRTKNQESSISGQPIGHRSCEINPSSQRQLSITVGDISQLSKQVDYALKNNCIIGLDLAILLNGKLAQDRFINFCNFEELVKTEDSNLKHVTAISLGEVTTKYNEGKINSLLKDICNNKNLFSSLKKISFGNIHKGAKITIFPSIETLLFKNIDGFLGIQDVEKFSLKELSYGNVASQPQAILARLEGLNAIGNAFLNANRIILQSNVGNLIFIGFVNNNKNRTKWESIETIFIYPQNDLLNKRSKEDIQDLLNNIFSKQDLFKNLKWIEITKYNYSDFKIPQFESRIVVTFLG